MQQLRHLCAVVDHGQIGAAAKAVAITQPALSRSIHNLEKALGVQLLERSHEGVVPTVYGQLFVEHARTVVNEMQRARDNLQALRGLARGKVTFGITANFERYLVPRVLGRLMSDNPAITVYAMTGFYEDISVRVRTGELDFAFALLPPAHGHEDLVEENVLPVSSHVYARSTHPLATRREISLAEIASQVWIVPDQPAHRTYERYFEVLGLSAPQAVLKTPSIPLMLAVLRTAQVVGLFPDHIIHDGIKSGEVVKLNVLDLPGLTHAALVRRRDSLISPAARTLMDAIRGACQAVAGRMAGAPSPKPTTNTKRSSR